MVIEAPVLCPVQIPQKNGYGSQKKCGGIFFQYLSFLYFLSGQLDNWTERRRIRKQADLRAVGLSSCLSNVQAFCRFLTRPY